MKDLELTQTREDVAALKALREHSEASRTYLRTRINTLWSLVNDPGGLSERVTRSEERVDQIEKRLGRLLKAASAAVPIVAAVATALMQWLLGKF